MEVTREQAERIIDSKEAVDNEEVTKTKGTNGKANEKMKG